MSRRKARMNNPEPSVVLMSLNTMLSPEAELVLMQSLLYEETSVKQIQGRWAGEDELAYVIVTPNARQSSAVGHLAGVAKTFGQEEIWVLLEPENSGERRTYRLTEPDFKHAEHIGYFMPCGVGEAQASGNFSLDLESGQYYILDTKA